MYTFVSTNYDLTHILLPISHTPIPFILVLSCLFLSCLVLLSCIITSKFRFIGRNWHGRCVNGLRRRGCCWRSRFHYGGSNSSWWEPQAQQTERTAAARHFQQIDSKLRAMCSSKDFARDDGQHGAVSRSRRLLVITAQWDNNFHHFIIDELVRLVRHHDWLLRNPDVKIHIRAGEAFGKRTKAPAALAMRRRILSLLGFDASRIVSGTVVADQASAVI